MPQTLVLSRGATKSRTHSLEFPNSDFAPNGIRKASSAGENLCAGVDSDNPDSKSKTNTNRNRELVDDIPLTDDLLTIILKRVTTEDSCCSYSLVCKRWYTLRGPAQLKATVRDGARLSQSSLLKQLQSFPNLRSLKFNSQSISFLSDAFLFSLCRSLPNLQELEVTEKAVVLGNTITSSGIAAALLRFHSLTSLTLLGADLRRSRNVSIPDLPSSAQSRIRGLKLSSWGDRGARGAYFTVQSLPPSFWGLTSLSQLSLRMEITDRLPDAVSQLVSLTELELIVPCLRSLPESFRSLTALSTLKLHSAAMRRLPPPVFNLPRLTDLTLSLPTLREFPPELASMPTLQRLDLSECTRIDRVPVPMVGAQDPDIPEGANPAVWFSSLRSLSLNCSWLSHLAATLSTLSSRNSSSSSGGNSFQLQDLSLCCKTLGMISGSIGPPVLLPEVHVSGAAALGECLGSESLKYLTSLTIDSCCVLSTLPACVGNLQQLRELRVSSCHGMKTLPESLGRLGSLTRLHIGGFLVKEIPAGVWQLRNLQQLKLIGCDSLTELPLGMGSLSRLSTLQIVQCPKLRKLPDSIGRLASLEVLELRGLAVCRKLPDELGSLRQLKSLCCADMLKLERLPSSIGNLGGLRSLHVEECKELKSLPAQMGLLQSLQVLTVASCPKVKILPSSMGEMRALRKVQICNLASLGEVPSSLGLSESLDELVVRGCKMVVSLPASLENGGSVRTVLDNSGGDDQEALRPWQLSCCNTHLGVAESCGVSHQRGAGMWMKRTLHTVIAQL